MKIGGSRLEKMGVASIEMQEKMMRSDDLGVIHARNIEEFEGGKTQNRWIIACGGARYRLQAMWPPYFFFTLL